MDRDKLKIIEWIRTQYAVVALTREWRQIWSVQGKIHSKYYWINLKQKTDQKCDFNGTSIMTSPQSEISNESAVYNSQYYVEQQNQLLTNSVGGTNSASSASTDVDEWFFPQHEVKTWKSWKISLDVKRN